jgi:uncharacterized membrane protein YphA (DoxX/SURF4 family)
MDRIKYLNKWANRHTYWPLDIARMALGVFLFFKGITFMSDSQMLMNLFEPFRNMAGGMIIIHYVVPAHLIGGIVIFFGLLTRWAIIAQLPILLGAVLINFIGEMNYGNFLMASFTLVTCVFFLIYGSGKHSADYYFKMQQ